MKSLSNCSSVQNVSTFLSGPIIIEHVFQDMLMLMDSKQSIVWKRPSEVSAQYNADSKSSISKGFFKNPALTAILNLCFRCGWLDSHLIKKNEPLDGIYECIFLVNDEWQTITIDDSLFFAKYSDGEYRLLGSETTNTYEFWPSLIEKALAVVTGSYFLLSTLQFPELYKMFFGLDCLSLNGKIDKKLIDISVNDELSLIAVGMEQSSMNQKRTKVPCYFHVSKIFSSGLFIKRNRYSLIKISGVHKKCGFTRKSTSVSFNQLAKFPTIYIIPSSKFRGYSGRVSDHMKFQSKSNSTGEAITAMNAHHLKTNVGKNCGDNMVGSDVPTLFRDPFSCSEECNKSLQLHFKEAIEINDIKWMRPGEVVENPIMYADGIIVQGCFLDPGLVTVLNLWLRSSNGDSDYLHWNQKEGKFSFRFFVNGHSDEVEVDDRLPWRKDYQGQWTLLGAKSTRINEFGGALIEKSLVNLYRDYSILLNLQIPEAFKLMTGAYCICNSGKEHAIELEIFKDKVTKSSLIAIRRERCEYKVTNHSTQPIPIKKLQYYHVKGVSIEPKLFDGQILCAIEKVSGEKSQVFSNCADHTLNRNHKSIKRKLRAVISPKISYVGEEKVILFKELLTFPYTYILCWSAEDVFNILDRQESDKINCVRFIGLTADDMSGDGIKFLPKILFRIKSCAGIERAENISMIISMGQAILPSKKQLKVA